MFPVKLCPLFGQRSGHSLEIVGGTGDVVVTMHGSEGEKLQNNNLC